MKNIVNKKNLKPAIKKLIIDNCDKDMVIITHTRNAVIAVNEAISEAQSEISGSEINYILDRDTANRIIYEIAFVVRSTKEEHSILEKTYYSTNVSVKYWKRYYKNIIDIDADFNINSLGDTGVTDLKGKFVIQINNKGEWVSRYKYEDEIDRELQKIVDELETKDFSETAVKSESNVTIGIPYCQGQMCHKRKTCKYHVYDANNDKVMREYHDYSMEGSGSADSNGYCRMEYTCGNHGNYKMYKPVDNENNYTESNTLKTQHDENKSETVDNDKSIRKFTIRQPGMAGGKFVCSECGGGDFEYSLNDRDCLIIRCCWCDNRSVIELPENSSILRDKCYRKAWNNFIGYFKFCTNRFYGCRTSLNAETAFTNIGLKIIELKKYIRDTQNTDKR